MGSTRAVKTALSRAETHLARARDAYVPTPTGLAETLTGWPYSMFGDPSGFRCSVFGAGPRVLEPSAGDGRLVAAILDADPDAQVVAVEPDDARRAAIAGRAAGDDPDRASDRVARVTVHGGTFEEYAAQNPYSPAFDAVIMNPPFSLPDRPRVWIDHVLLAWDLLLPGGRLAAVVPNSLAMPGKAGTRLAELLAQHGGTDVHDVDRAAVKEGFPSRVRVLYLVKPMPTGGGRPSYLIRPVEGKPVKVRALDVRPRAAMERPVQEYSDWSDGYRLRVVRYAGTCASCARLLWTHDDGGEPPLSWAACSVLDPAEDGKTGPQIGLCLECASHSDRWARAHELAAPWWTDTDTEPAGPAVYPGDLGVGLYVTVPGVDGHGRNLTITGWVAADPEPTDRGGAAAVVVKLRTRAGVGVALAELYVDPAARVTVHDAPAADAPTPPPVADAQPEPEPVTVPDVAPPPFVSGWRDVEQLSLI